MCVDGPGPKTKKRKIPYQIQQLVKEAGNTNKPLPVLQISNELGPA